MDSNRLACVEVELDIIQEELKAAGVSVPWDVLAKWRISSRAQAEQWAIRTRWASLKRSPCPSGHRATPGPIPAIVKKWMKVLEERPN